MKRDPRLQGLSSDHHQGLVLARTVRDQSQRWTPAAGLTLAERFDAELEPHFRVEEELLLPHLRLGAPALVDRVVDDHATLRRHVGAARDGDASMARAFAQLLHDHIRFEESELFPTCERLLSDEVLDCVWLRWPKTHP